MPILPDETDPHALHLATTITNRLRDSALSQEGFHAALVEICRLTDSTGGVLFRDTARHHDEDRAPAAPICQWGTLSLPDLGHNADNRPDLLHYAQPLRPCGTIRLALKRASISPPDVFLEKNLELTLQIMAGFMETKADYVRVLKALGIHPCSRLPDWQGFQENVARRIPRLDRSGSPATLMLVQVEEISNCQPSSIHEDDPVLKAARFLRQAIRPTDLVGQIGTDTFAIWLDGGDRFAGAERAAQISRTMLNIKRCPSVRFRIGLTAREPKSMESFDILLERARLGLYMAQRENVSWRFFHEEA